MIRTLLPAAAAGAALACLALVASAAPAKARTARCVIAGGGTAPYRGPCRFSPEKGGSFSLDPVGRKTFPGGIGTVSVFITAPGAAEVSGLTSAGINSRWGEARRSKRDAACWEGEDFRICVY